MLEMVGDDTAATRRFRIDAEKFGTTDGVVGHDPDAQGRLDAIAGAVEHDHGDEGVGVVEAAGVGVDAA